RGDVRAPVAAFGAAVHGREARKPTPGYLQLRNDRGAREIRLGAREFECIGQSPPHDHPHVHMDMGSQDTILCPYCGTRYRRDDSLAPWQADPADAVVEDVDARRGVTHATLLTAHLEAREAAKPRSRDARGSIGARTSLHSQRRIKMFGHQG